MKTTDVLSLTPGQCFHQREQQGCSHRLMESTTAGPHSAFLGTGRKGPSATETSTQCVYLGTRYLFFLETQPELGG